MMDKSGFQSYLAPGLRAPAGSEVSAHDSYDFSVILGGPLFQMFRRAHLCGDALQLVRRRILAITLFAWFPLLILSALGGHLRGDAVRIPFLNDIEAHVRFLLALPMLLIAELVVHQRMLPLARQFLDRGMISDASRARFDMAVASAWRLRNSVVAEVLLIVAVYLFSILFVWPRHIAVLNTLSITTWYALPAGGSHALTPAGWWFLYVSLPLFQFLLLRWYFRLFIWIRFLAAVAGCQPRVVPTHPDRAGGLGFLSDTVVAFAPLLLAHGMLLAGLIANRIFFRGATLLDFKAELVVVPVFLLLVVLGPLLLFMPRLAEARRVGLREYGTFAQRYVREFDDKWLRGGAPAGEPLIGSADIQSLADLGNSFEIVRSLRSVPITKEALVQLAVITLVPVAPLILTMVPLDELVKRLLQVVF
jgi:hypothetical protein